MSDITLFPKYITIYDKNHSKKYASRNGPEEIKFTKDEIDQYCYLNVYEQIDGTNKIKLKLDNGNYVYTHSNQYIHSGGNASVFELIKLENEGENIYAIKSSNGNFVAVYDKNGMHNLKADRNSIDRYCKFKIEEPIIKKEINGQLEVSIPPRKKGTVSIIVSKASMDVPFTYTTRTRYLNGEIVEKNNINGIYRNLESYLIQGDTSELTSI